MKVFIDSEFIDTGSKIELISIALVKETGEKYYAINKNCNFRKADQWIKDNVISKLPYRDDNFLFFTRRKQEKIKWKNKKQIIDDICLFLNIEKEISYVIRNNLLFKYIDYFLLKYFPKLISKKINYKYIGKEKIEFWGDYCEYDYVVFCQLFGKMIDLPKGLPMHFYDLRDLSNYLDIEIPIQDEINRHDALEDALWIKRMYEYLNDKEFNLT